MIKNILFDLGNVIIDIDFNRTIEAFRSLGAQDFFVDLDQTGPIFYNLEVGNIEPEQFTEYWKTHCNLETSDGIIHAWNALLIGIKDEIFPLLKELKEHFQLYVYSNTNAIHIAWVMNYLNKQHGINDWVPELFNAVYYSHQLGSRKPEASGFITILNEQNIQASETLFIDDHLPNIEAAMKLGFQTLHKPAQTSLVDAMTNNKLLTI